MGVGGSEKHARRTITLGVTNTPSVAFCPSIHSPVSLRTRGGGVLMAAGSVLQ